MFIKVLVLFVKMGQLFGKIPFIIKGKHKLVILLLKVYPGIVASLIFLHYLGSSKFNGGGFNKTKFVRYVNNSLSIILCSYISSNEWTRWFELFESMDKSLKANLSKSRSFGLKLNGILIANMAIFLFIRSFRNVKSYREDFISGLILYISLFGKFSPLILLTILEESFKEINSYWRNIYKWQRIGLKIKRGKDTLYCKNEYKVIYEMYLCFQKIFGLVTAINFLELLGTILFFANSAVARTSLKNIKVLNFFISSGSHTQFLVSMCIF